MPEGDTPPPAVPALRASDADRERAADALRRHAGEGRLDTDELEERLTGAYGARSTADLTALTADLPALADRAPGSSPGPAGADPAHVEARRALRGHLVQTGGAAAAVSLLCVVIWAATGTGYFWPLWVLLGSGAGVGGTWWRGLGPGGDPVRELERAEDRAAARREHRGDRDRHGRGHGPRR